MVFKNITGLDTDGYCEKIAEFMASTFKDVVIFDEKYASVMKMYAITCEYFMIDKNDEKASNSFEFFKFFTQFFD
jgi:hypothetical protein